MCVELEFLKTGKSIYPLMQGCTGFKESRNHLKILSVRRIMGSKFGTEDKQILGAIIQNVVTTVTICPGFVHRYINGHVHLFVPGLKNVYRPQCGSRLERLWLSPHTMHRKI